MKIANFDPADDWHTYEIQWTPNYISWALDGQEVRKVQGTASVRDITKAKALFMDFWTPEFAGWGDNMEDDATMPWYTRYDWVEVYDYNQWNDSFTLKWRDDFNTLDLDRWFRSDGWSFDLNSSLFLASNTYVENGKLVLKMEVNDYQDKPIDNTVYYWANACRED